MFTLSETMDLRRSATHALTLMLMLTLPSPAMRMVRALLAPLRRLWTGSRWNSHCFPMGNLDPTRSGRNSDACSDASAWLVGNPPRDPTHDDEHARRTRRERSTTGSRHRVRHAYPSQSTSDPTDVCAQRR